MKVWGPLGPVPLSSFTIADIGGKLFWVALGDGQEANVLTEAVIVLLDEHSVKLSSFHSCRLTYNDALVDPFPAKNARARLPNEPSVIDVVPGDPSGTACRLGKNVPRPILSNQQRYMANASLPSPKNRNKAKPTAI